jgi:dual specificity phosphatase 12
MTITKLFNVNYFQFLYYTNMIANANKIIPYLWVGNARAALDDNFIKKNRIGVIINCTMTEPFNSTSKQKLYKVRVPLTDNTKIEENKKLIIFSEKVLPLIHDALGKNIGVLVHCHAGVQRSASMVALYLMKYYGFDMDESIKHIRSRRPVAFYGHFNYSGNLNVNFEAALRIYEKMMKKL